MRALSNRSIQIPAHSVEPFAAVVYHGTTCGKFNKDRSFDSVLRIGRYMFEKDDYLQAKKRSPQKRDLDRIFGCSKRMDEIWITSEWQRKIFARHVPDHQIFVVPEAVDATLFDPALAKAVKTPFEYGTRDFVFLSVFAWSYRKGWDILLDAYFKAFSAEDAVVLSTPSLSSSSSSPLH